MAVSSGDNPSQKNRVLDSQLSVKPPQAENAFRHHGTPGSQQSKTVAYELLSAARLGEKWAAQWEQLRGSSPNFRSPFFSSRFAQVLASCVDDVQLAVARCGEDLIAVLPIQVDLHGCARPAGLGINDAHGILCLPNSSVQALELLAGCGLTNYAFHASPPQLTDCSIFEVGRTRSFLADLTVDPKGYEHYLRKSSTTIDRQGQKTRRLIRDAGPLRFEFDCQDASLLDLLISWKQQQYQRTHTFDILGVAWIQRLLHSLHVESRNGLHGLLSVLYAGEKPVAMHYGMREGDLLHYWFPVFDNAYAVGSPGTQLFLEVVKECEQQGIRAIDMGYGEQRYKHKLTNVITEMSYGLIDSSSFRRGLYRTTNAMRCQLKQMRVKDKIKPWVRKVFPRFGGKTYDA